MKIFEVTTDLLNTQFYQLPNKLYEGNENWFPPLGADLDQVFSKDKNSLFQHGDLKRWVALDKWNNFSGRIAAFFSHNEGSTKSGFGFFESTDDYEVSKSLLDTAFEWLQRNQCTYIEGPVNFGEKDRFWGLLTSGFDTPCIYLENYNPPYYELHFKKYGLSEKDIICTYKVQLDELPADRLKLITDRLKSKYNIEMIPFSFEKMDKFVYDIHEVYSTAFKEDTRLKLVTPEDIRQLIMQALPVLSDELIWLAYQQKKPVGFLAFMKDLNQLLRNNTEEITLKGFGVAVVPGYRKTGVEPGLSCTLLQSLRRHNKPCTLYFTGVNSKTEAMTSFMKKLNASVIKQHTTFQLNLKRSS